MPKNFKEELVFTGLIAGMMVFGMTMYNVFKASGISMESWGNVATGFHSLYLSLSYLILHLLVRWRKKLSFLISKKRTYSLLLRNLVFLFPCL